MDYAIKSLKMRADSGDTNAMLELGKKYLNGDGVKHNINKANGYFQKAAKHGCIEGYLELGKLNRGLCMYDRAEEVLTKAANLGSYEAMCLLATLYNGDYFHTDIDKAIQWLEKPANAGYAPAQLMLGQLYNRKFEGEKRKECLIWFKKAAEQGNAEAQYEYGERLTEFEPDKPIIEILKESEEWLKKAAENGYTEAYCALGDMYGYADEPFFDEEKAVAAFTAAIQAGVNGAQTSLGAFYCDNGNAEKGIAAYEKAAEDGDKTACLLLGNNYYDGDIVKRDYDRAFYWYNRSIDKYYEHTYFGVARCYLYGAGVEKNEKKAVKLLRKAARYSADSRYELGNCYFNGWGVKQDREKAKLLWEKAAEEDNEDAQKALEENFK